MNTVKWASADDIRAAIAVLEKREVPLPREPAEDTPDLLLALARRRCPHWFGQER